MSTETPPHDPLTAGLNTVPNGTYSQPLRYVDVCKYLDKLALDDDD